MSHWLKAIGITCLVTSVWMITGEWLHYLKHKEVRDEHTPHVSYTEPTQASVWITRLMIWPGIRSVGTRVHLVA